MIDQIDLPHETPRLGLSVPVWYKRSVDGDTLDLQLPGGSLKWRVRLLNCWCKELNRGTTTSKTLGREALRYADALLSDHAKDLRAWFPIPEDLNLDEMNPLDMFSFNRLLGAVYIGRYGQELGRILVEAGLASSEKGGVLGE